MIMMSHKILPIKEEIRGGIPVILFCLFWYYNIISVIVRGGFTVQHSIFLVAGLIPVVTIGMQAKRAFFYRRQRKEAKALGNVVQGKIVNVVRKTMVVDNERNGGRFQYNYFLTVEITDPCTGIANEFESEAYRKPLHHYLSSPYVQVYTDETGWQHYIEGFQLKANKNDPDIFPGRREYEPSTLGQSAIPIIIAIIILLMFISRNH